MESECKWPMTELLLQLGENINIGNGSFLIGEINKGNLNGVERLLKLGASPYIKSDHLVHKIEQISTILHLFL